MKTNLRKQHAVDRHILLQRGGVSWMCWDVLNTYIHAACSKRAYRCDCAVAMWVPERSEMSVWRFRWLVAASSSSSTLLSTNLFVPLPYAVSREKYSLDEMLYTDHHVDDDDLCQTRWRSVHDSTMRCSIHYLCSLSISLCLVSHHYLALHSFSPSQSFRRTVLYFVIQHVRKTPLLWIRTRDGLRRPDTCVRAYVHACVQPSMVLSCSEKRFMWRFSFWGKKNSCPFSRTKNRVPLHAVLLLLYHPSLSFTLSLKQDPCCQASPWHSCSFSLLFISLPSLSPFCLFLSSTSPFCQPAFQSHFPLAFSSRPSSSPIFTPPAFTELLIMVGMLVGATFCSLSAYVRTHMSKWISLSVSNRYSHVGFSSNGVCRALLYHSNDIGFLLPYFFFSYLSLKRETFSKKEMSKSSILRNVSDISNCF